MSVSLPVRDSAKRAPAILSNGSPRMLQAAAKSAGIDRFLARIISVDEIKIYKPSPRVHELGPKRLQTAREATGFVSSNAWDVGARLSLEWRDGKLFARRGKEAPVELLRDGDAVFAPTTLRRYRCNGSTLTIGDGKRWADDLPRAP